MEAMTLLAEMVRMPVVVGCGPSVSARGQRQTVASRRRASHPPRAMPRSADICRVWIKSCGESLGCNGRRQSGIYTVRVASTRTEGSANAECPVDSSMPQLELADVRFRSARPIQVPTNPVMDLTVAWVRRPLTASLSGDRSVPARRPQVGSLRQNVQRTDPCSGRAQPWSWPELGRHLSICSSLPARSASSMDILLRSRGGRRIARSRLRSRLMSRTFAHRAHRAVKACPNTGSVGNEASIELHRNLNDANYATELTR
jgi:hypothetical protein